jgi:alanine dehydrogenase
MKKIKVGILKETKTPPDRRAAIVPKHSEEIAAKFPHVEFVIQSSDIRAFRDEEYREKGFKVVDDVSDCDILIGVKEVAISELISKKSYMFFSHTGKKQSHNRPLLQALLKNKIRLLDHEYLTDIKGNRMVAFGNWAGVVGAYNGIMAFGLRKQLFHLKRAVDCADIHELKLELQKISLPQIKILITGGGRVAQGAVEILNVLNIERISPEDFLNKTFEHAVYTQLDPQHYVQRVDGCEFDLNHFFKSPEMYISTFKEYPKITDIYLACHFWNEKSPVFISKNDIESQDFNISVIADISCDVNGPIASTIRPSKIAEPFYGYHKQKHIEELPFSPQCITVMAVDNLPGEVPRESSEDFGNGLISRVFPALFGTDTEQIIERASITTLEGKLGKHFQYLENFVAGIE